MFFIPCSGSHPESFIVLVVGAEERKQLGFLSQIVCKQLCRNFLTVSCDGLDCNSVEKPGRLAPETCSTERSNQGKVSINHPAIYHSGGDEGDTFTNY